VSRSDNPYVGPRAFVTGEPLYGRDRERAALLDLLIAERVVVLHSPSGAGKSSLVMAGLIPDLIAEGFTVRPVIRVGMAPEDAGVNRYVASALRCLDEGSGATTLAAALGAGEAAEVLIFDQFEEVLTLDPHDRAAKLGFFAALGEALRSPRIWALFVMREEFVASLTPYVRALPNADAHDLFAARPAGRRRGAGGGAIAGARARRGLSRGRGAQAGRRPASDPGPDRGGRHGAGARAPRRAGAAAGHLPQPVGAQGPGRRGDRRPTTWWRSATSIGR
jgi:hypothetical protein